MSSTLQIDFLQHLQGPEVEKTPPPPAPTLAEYDRIAVAFSGGKDSVASVLHLLDLGINPSRIELHHHRVDGVSGFGRASCMTCIFLTDPAWATLQRIDPVRVARHVANEKTFGKTIHRTRSLSERIGSAEPFADLDPQWVHAAMSATRTLPIRIPPDTWTLPRGAFQESGGPT